MKRFVAFAASLLFLSLAAHGTAQSTPEKPRVSVTIDSRPEHAEIRVGGRFIGTTPLSYRLTPGEHKIELVRGEYESWTRDLSVTDTPTKVVALLKRNQTQDCR